MTCTTCIYLAYCELTPHLDCYSWIVKESIRYGDKWNKQWAQEYSRQRLMHELPAKLAMHAKPIHTNIYPTWEGYLKEFIIAGIHIAYTVCTCASPCNSYRW